LKYLTLLKKRTVYGGGGIMPDVFIPLDTSMNFNLTNQLVRKNIYNMFAIDNMGNIRNQLLKNYPTKEIFRENM